MTEPLIWKQPIIGYVIFYDGGWIRGIPIANGQMGVVFPTLDNEPQYEIDDWEGKPKWVIPCLQSIQAVIGLVHGVPTLLGYEWPGLEPMDWEAIRANLDAEEKEKTRRIQEASVSTVSENEEIPF